MAVANDNPNFSMIYTSYSANLPQLELDVDVDKAMAQGVEISEVYNAIAAYLPNLMLMTLISMVVFIVYMYRLTLHLGLKLLT